MLIGGNHPNDISVEPPDLMKLWEGDRAAWSEQSLTDLRFKRPVFPKAPKTIAVKGARMAKGLVREFGVGALSVASSALCSSMFRDF